MSSPSVNPKSYETTESDSEYGGSPPANPPAPRESSESEEVERRSTKAAPSSASELEQQHRGLSSPSEPNDDAETCTRKGKLKGGVRKHYRDLLNSIIEDVNQSKAQTDDPLPASLIEGAFWSSAEKEAFFNKLAVCGPGDLRLLSETVRTKTEAEIHVYLQLLQNGVAELHAREKASSGKLISQADVPAASEISAECESELDAFAETLCRKIETLDADAEREAYGDSWLINEELAEKIEQAVIRQNNEAPANGADDDSIQATPSVSQDDVLIPSAGLLNAASFLQLSRNLFMIPRPDSADSSWILGLLEDSGPAIYRTAFDDFHNLTVSLTRRLVQATIFQAMSRLRAGDGARTNWQPKAEVREIDVTTAYDVLAFDNDWQSYWAKLPRRRGLEVYSESKDYYRDGRKRTKTGFKLTYDEVEVALGCVPESLPPPADPSTSTGACDYMDYESDEYTLISEDDRSIPPLDEESNEPDAARVATNLHIPDVKREPASDSESKGHRNRQRKRALSPVSFIRKENQYLESLDRQTGGEEERRLRELLRLIPAESVNSEIEKVSPPLAPKDLESQSSGQWRKRARHGSEWEHFEQSTNMEHFVQMNEIGRRGRKRRKQMRESMHGDSLVARRDVSSSSASSQELSDFDETKDSDERGVSE